MQKLNDYERNINAIFSAVIDGSDTLIHVIDRNFTVLDYNEACRKWLRKLNLNENVYRKRIFEMFPFLPVDIVRPQYQQVFDTGEVLTTENQIEIKGVPYYNITKKIPVKVGDKVLYIITMVSELTEFTNTREALQESHEKLKIVFDSIEELVFVINSKGTIIQTNSTALRRLGYSESELIGKNIEELHPLEQRESVKYKFKEAIKGQQSFHTKLFLSKIGINIPVETCVTRARWGKEDIFIGVARDISEKLLMESLRDILYDFSLKLSDIRNLDEIYKVCLDSAIKAGNFDSGGIYVFLPSGDLQLVHHTGLSNAFVEKKAYFNASSKNVEIVLEGEPKYLLYEQLATDELFFVEGLMAVAIIPVKYQGKVISCLNLASHINKEISQESRHILETIAFQIGIGIARVMAEIELRTQEEQFARAFDANPALLTIIKLMDDTILEASQGFLRALEYSRDEIIGKTTIELGIIDPDVRTSLVEKFEKEGFLKDYEIYIHKRKGEKLYGLLSAEKFDYKGNNCMLIVMLDTTGRKLALDALHESEVLYRATIDSIDHAIHVIDKDRKIIVVNREFERWAKKFDINTSILGKTPTEAFPFLSNKVNAEYDIVFSTGKPVINEEENIVNTEHIYTETRKLPVFDGNVVNRVVTSVEDITVRKKAEMAIRRRLEIEAMLARASTAFINLEPERFEYEVQKVLNNFRELLGVDRFSVCILNDARTRFKNVIQSCLPSVKSTIEQVYLLKLDEYPSLVERFIDGKIISLDDIVTETTSTSPISLFFKEIDTKSLLAAPIISRGQLLGLIIFTMSSHTRIWNEEDSLVLKMVGETIANALIYITQSESLKESEEKNRGLIDTSPNYIFLLEGEQTIVDCNKLASTLFNTPANLLRTKSIMDLGRDIGINVEELRNMFLKINAGEDIGPVEIEVMIPSDLKKKIWLELKISSLKIKGKQYLQVVGNDITKQKHAEQLVNEELNKLKLFDRMRTEFIYRASHELKTPLSAVCGASALLSEYGAVFSEEELDLVNIIIKGGDRLRHLIDSIIDSFKIEGNSLQLKKERINIVDTIQSVVQQHTYFIKQRKQNLSIKLPVVQIIAVDIERIESVINNLLINAINNTPPGGDISIQLLPLENRIELRIADTGIGITPEEKQRLFTKFGKIERYGKGINLITEGTGLGLYISKNIVELHGGTIRVESEGRDKGSTFIVTLPVKNQG